MHECKITNETTIAKLIEIIEILEELLVNENFFASKNVNKPSEWLEYFKLKKELMDIAL